MEVDNRRPNVELGKQLGVSEATIRRRIERLTAEGYVRRVAVVNPSRMGLFDAIIGIRADPDKVVKVAEELTKMDKTRYVAICTGPFDIVATAYFQTHGDVFEFITNEVGKIPGIRRCETIQILKNVKRNYIALP